MRGYADHHFSFGDRLFSVASWLVRALVPTSNGGCAGLAKQNAYTWVSAGAYRHATHGAVRDSYTCFPGMIPPRGIVFACVLDTRLSWKVRSQAVVMASSS